MSCPFPGAGDEYIGRVHAKGSNLEVVGDLTMPLRTAADLELGLVEFLDEGTVAE